MQKLINLKNKKGFTLIEMLVVILIIVILITIAVPAVAGYRRDAQTTADLAAAKIVFTALEAAATKESPENTSFLVGVSAGTGDRHTAGWNVASLTTLAADTTASADARAYASEVLAFLGSNFKGDFAFGFNTVSGSVNWVTYRRETDLGNNATMLYHAKDGVDGYITDSDLSTKYNTSEYQI